MSVFNAISRYWKNRALAESVQRGGFRQRERCRCKHRRVKGDREHATLHEYTQTNTTLLNVILRNKTSIESDSRAHRLSQAVAHLRKSRRHRTTEISDETGESDLSLANYLICSN